ncbi:acyltransferase family protein [Zwartia sp.]|uniref:acyltransferase family protein n=1 Tax=Zwartia sp. TaxID=2978004 RepID=UPI003BB1B636
MARRLPFIDAAKGIACLVIVVHHLAVYGPMSEVIGAVYSQLIDAIVVYGRLAVQLFFVVAGYFVASQFAPKGCTTPINPGPLVWKRYKRLITPFLFAVTLAALITALVRPWFQHASLSAAPTIGQLLAHLFLLYDLIGLEALSAGVWYVAVDFQLFALTMVLIALIHMMPARWHSLLPVVVTALTAWSLWHLSLHSQYEIAAPYFFGYYGLGMLSYWAARTPAKGWFLILIALLGLVALGIEFRKSVATATVSALILSIASARGWLEQWPRSARLHWLGERSYSIFLIHYGLIIGINALWSVWFPSGILINLLGIAVAVAVSIAGGAVLYRFVESRPGVLGLNLTTALLVTGILVTLALESYNR